MGIGVPCMRSGFRRMGTDARGWWVPATILGGLVMLGSGGCRMYWLVVSEGIGTVSGLLERRSSNGGDGPATMGEPAASRLGESAKQQTPVVIRYYLYYCSTCIINLLAMMSTTFRPVIYGPCSRTGVTCVVSDFGGIIWL